MLTKILNALRKHRIYTGLGFIVVYALLYGPAAVAYAGIALVFAVAFFVLITSGDDDDFFDNFNPWKFT